ncbi:META domain-containing protein [Actinoplanes teichomyceticus]|uniref:META domain-containing protein n=1 Tax=Actinoplanes teichomyceticus TaxID=1867 RepID=UPI0013DE081A|nr:META domain-containing protein [Actinoplanes teichomyceticus]
MITSLTLFAAPGAGLPAATTSAPPLTETRWVVAELVEPAGVTPVTAARPAYLIFHASGEVEGYDTCNWVSASAVVADAETLALTDFSMTKRLCRDSVPRVESAVGHVLHGEIAYRLEADTLRLTHPDGRGLVLRADAG